MVTTVNVTLDDEEADRLKKIKNELGMTWPEFLTEAGEALADERGVDP